EYGRLIKYFAFFPPLMRLFSKVRSRVFVKYQRSVVLFLSLMVLCAGCSVRSIAVNALSEALSADESLVFTGEEDPKLVAEAMPVMLKTYEALLERAPHDRELLIATGKAFTLYAFAFVQIPAERLPDSRADERMDELLRARALYRRGRDYLFTALDLEYPGFSDLTKKGKTDTALAMVTAADTTALYWTAVAWMGQLTAGKPGLSAVFNLPKAARLMHEVIAFNDSFGEGAAHEMLVTYYGSLPESVGGSLEKAREHFEKAVAIAGGTHVRPYVALATVAAREGNREEFEQLLQKALDIDTDHRTRHRLTNVIYQDMARWMLDNAETVLMIED
ncbi:MAG: hypothetical protein GF331_02320, partial [Chitinivibrionales bacterium]|nr:hypothetical protein [Chitinivibrionales bacterium]